jgi:hypothetical protein
MAVEKAERERVQKYENLSVENKAKVDWDKDPALRSEFTDDFSVYLGYVKGVESGRIRILAKKF